MFLSLPVGDGLLIERLIMVTHKPSLSDLRLVDTVGGSWYHWYWPADCWKPANWLSRGLIKGDDSESLTFWWAWVMVVHIWFKYYWIFGRLEAQICICMCKIKLQHESNSPLFHFDDLSFCPLTLLTLSWWYRETVTMDRDQSITLLTQEMTINAQTHTNNIFRFTN